MRWQDDVPIHELIAEGAQIEGAYLTIARVGEDRKEAQIGSHPIATTEEARAWLDRTADDALGEADDVRLRIRLWRSDRTTVRSVQTRAWPDLQKERADDAPPIELLEGQALDEPRAEPMPAIARRAHRVVPPVHAATPCPTCAVATTTTAVLQSRIAELSAVLGAAQSAVRDARRDTRDAEERAQSHGRRASEADAAIARLRSANADLTRENTRLRGEVTELYNGIAEINAHLDAHSD